jgi:hypothetical protein
LTEPNDSINAARFSDRVGDYLEAFVQAVVFLSPVIALPPAAEVFGFCVGFCGGGYVAWDIGCAQLAGPGGVDEFYTAGIGGQRAWRWRLGF